LAIVFFLALAGALLAQSGRKTDRKARDSHAVTPYPENADAQKTIFGIDIDSTLNFSGHSEFQEWSAIFIHREKGVFRRVLRGKGAGSVADGEAIDAALIEALHAALNEPPIVKPDLKNLVINVDWFKEYISASLMQSSPSSPKQAVSKSFPDLAVVKRIVRSMFNDQTSEFSVSPIVRVTVFFDGNSQVEFTSGAGPFMLPWYVMRNGKEIPTYNANISRALVALVPPETLNRDDLTGQDFGVRVVDAVRQYIESHWKLLHQRRTVVRTP